MRIGPLKLFEPARYIGGRENPLIVRWTLFRLPRFGIFLHKFCRSDHDRALHCHPWTFISIILRGGYSEIYQLPDAIHPCEDWRGPGSILYRPAEWKHRVVLAAGKASWNLILVGRRRRKWGFWPNGQFCWWRKYNYRLGICEEEILQAEGDD
jgi:hypothetical protein